MVAKMMYAKPRGSFELSVKTRNLTWSYDRENSQWTVPINAEASRLLKLASQRGLVYPGCTLLAEKPEGRPD